MLVVAAAEALPHLPDLLATLLFEAAHLCGLFIGTQVTVSFYLANALFIVTVNAVDLPVTLLCTKGVAIAGVVVIGPVVTVITVVAVGTALVSIRPCRGRRR